MAQKPSIPKGTRDFSPEEMAKRNYIFDTIKEVFTLHGFRQNETPSMENLSTLMGKYGEEGDKLLFKILNSGDFLKGVTDEQLTERNCPRLTSSLCEKGLRYDLTVPFARYVVQHRNELQFPFKRFQIQPVWRADRPQKGRYREFYQCDADVIGTDSLLNEIDLLEIIDEAFRRFGISITIKLKTGQIIFICDSIVLLLSVLAYGANSLLYSLITVCLASEITDLVIDGSRGIKAYYIITNKKEEVSNKIFETIKRGATEIKSTGMYTHQDKSMILCLINKYRAPMLKKLVLEIDPEAFVFSTNISEVLGNGFYVPQQKKNEKKKKLSKINSQNSNKPIELQNEKVEDNSINDATKNVEIENVENDCKNNENANTNNNIVSTPEDSLNSTTQKNKPKDI